MFSVTSSFKQQAPLVDIEALFAETERRLDMKRDTVARLQGLSASQLSQQLHGQGHPSLRRLIEMWFSDDPDGQLFVSEFFQVCSECLGFAQLDPVGNAIGKALINIGAAVASLRLAPPESARQPAQQRRRA